MAMTVDPVSGLILPQQFIDQKQSLKKVIDDFVDSTVRENSHLTRTYYLTIHAKFDDGLGGNFRISRPVITYKLPPFQSNSFVFWVNNKKSVCELLWMVSAKKPGQKLKVEFNKTGVAYLQAQGAMPS